MGRQSVLGFEPTDVEHVLNLLYSHDPILQEREACLVGTTNVDASEHGEFFEALQPLIQSGSLQVQRRAVAALGHVTDSRAVKALQDARSTDDKLTKAVAEQALAIVAARVLLDGSSASEAERTRMAEQYLAGRCSSEEEGAREFLLKMGAPGGRLLGALGPCVAERQVENLLRTPGRNAAALRALVRSPVAVQQLVAVLLLAASTDPADRSVLTELGATAKDPTLKWELHRAACLRSPGPETCGSPPPDPSAAHSYLEKVEKERGAKRLPSGVIYFEKKAGTGDAPKPSDKVKVHYIRDTH